MFKTTKEVFLHYMFLRQATVVQIDTYRIHDEQKEQEVQTHNHKCVVQIFIFIAIIIHIGFLYIEIEALLVVLIFSDIILHQNYWFD